MVESLRATAKRTAAVAAELSGLLKYKRKQSGLIIVMLHKINDESDALQLTLRPELLDAILTEIGASHEFVCMDDIEAKGSDRESQGGLKFAITFDDGYRDNYDLALPILKKHGAPAIIYLSTAHIDGKTAFWFEQLAAALSTTTEQYLDLKSTGFGTRSLETGNDRVSALRWLNARLKEYDQERRETIVREILEKTVGKTSLQVRPMLDWSLVREMSRAGVRFGSHTVTHPILSKEESERVVHELQESKNIIEKKAGLKVSSFAYPNGTKNDFDASVIAEVRNAGYRNACTTISGINRSDTPVYELHRIGLHNAMCTDAMGRFDPLLFWSKVLAVF
ncbi:MAG: polysaccharide deacetylase family protein [Gammaproteobacteria bacterium]|nr:polysaccharide deacetylase family protein [Gammaproteobacteria bacterium]